MIHVIVMQNGQQTLNVYMYGRPRLLHLRRPKANGFLNPGLMSARQHGRWVITNNGQDSHPLELDRHSGNFLHIRPLDTTVYIDTNDENVYYIP